MAIETHSHLCFGHRQRCWRHCLVHTRGCATARPKPRSRPSREPETPLMVDLRNGPILNHRAVSRRQETPAMRRKTDQRLETHRGTSPVMIPLFLSLYSTTWALLFTAILIHSSDKVRLVEPLVFFSFFLLHFSGFEGLSSSEWGRGFPFSFFFFLSAYKTLADFQCSPRSDSGPLGR